MQRPNVTNDMIGQPAATIEVGEKCHAFTQFDPPLRPHPLDVVPPTHKTARVGQVWV
jgi:hypothetical protein